MNRRVICRWVASVLLLLVGGLLAAGGSQLLRGGPTVWPDVVAPEPSVSGTAIGMLALGMLVLAAGGAALRDSSWVWRAVAMILFVFVAGAFWAHYALFDELSPTHMATNVVVSGVILVLLRFAARDRNGER